MPINKAALAALRALSYPASADLEKVYKVERSLRNIRKPIVLRESIRDYEISRGGRKICVRVYKPEHAQPKEELLLFFHGGGWVFESIDTYNRVCRNLTEHSGCTVASIDYGLAPENPFPAGLEDCYTVAKTIYEHQKQTGKRENGITVIGDSAGGNLAAAVSLLARDRGEFRIDRQILIYPAVYNDHSDRSPFQSVKEYGDGYLLTARRIEDFMNLYSGGNRENLNSPYLAPLLAKDLTDQPKTLIITAECDPLRDEGEAYAAALEKAGAEVVLHRMPDAFHGYFSLPYRFPQVSRSYEWIHEFLNQGDVK